MTLNDAPIARAVADAQSNPIGENMNLTDEQLLAIRRSHELGNSYDRAELATLRAQRDELVAALEQVLSAGEDGGDMENIDWTGIRDAIAKAKGA